MDYVDPTGLSPLDYLAKVKSSFDSDAKFRILGKADSLFYALGRITPDSSYSMMRTRRIGMATNLNQQLAANTPSSLKAASETQMRFYSSVMPDIEAAKTTEKATTIAGALVALTGEMRDAVDRYITAAADNPDLARDGAFERNVQKLVDKLTIYTAIQKGRLRSENQFYNVNIVNTSKNLAAIKQALADFVPGTVAAAPAADPDSAEASDPSDVVPASTDESTLDITA